MESSRRPWRATRNKSKRSLRRLKILSSILVGYLAFPSPAGAAVGQLDTSFGEDGKVTTSFEGGGSALAVVIQPDGRIVAAGVANTAGDPQLNFALARYDRRGSLDQTFDGDGKVTTDFGGREGIVGVAVQADGKIVAVGSTADDAPIPNGDFAVARYNPDGSLDQSFDGDGMITTEFGSPFEGGSDVAIQADGKIVVAGTTLVAGNGDFALARYNPDGLLDQSFDSDGKVTTDFPGHDDAAAIAIQPDGKIVVVGQIANNDFALARYNPDGSLDRSFDGDGKVRTDFGSPDTPADISFDTPADIAIQADGRIVVAGGTASEISDQDFAVARYNTDGSLDQSFDGDGQVTTDFGRHDGPSFSTGGLAIQRNAKIVVAARTASLDFSEQDFALARYNPDGSLDDRFDGDGQVITDFGGFDGAADVAIQQGGKAVAVGSTRPGGIGGLESFALARYRSH